MGMFMSNKMRNNNSLLSQQQQFDKQKQLQFDQHKQQHIINISNKNNKSNIQSQPTTNPNLIQTTNIY